MKASLASLTAAACATLLCAGAVRATPTPQENCDSARVTAWKTYLSCVDTVVATDAGCAPTGSCKASFDEFAAFAKCRHTYFKKWKSFQGASFTGSTCAVGLTNRFTDNGDGTVTDNLTRLTWEKKDNLDGTENLADPHDADNLYTWSTNSNNGDGTAFTSFLATVNGGFAGANGWRLPTLVELQTIVRDFGCTGVGLGPRCRCPSTPCVDPALDAANTQSDYCWSATSFVPDPVYAWNVYFVNGLVDFLHTKSYTSYVRAVRGGL
jgi:hypothetical protein